MTNHTMNKKDFPIFKKNPGLVYLDNAATSLKPKCVIDAVNDYFSNYSANVHRGIYDLSAKATSSYEGSRETVREFINAASTKEVIFTHGATEAINMVALSWGVQNLKSGDEVILTISEHHSNLVPWQLVAKKTNCAIRFVDIDDNGVLNLAQLSKLLSRRTKIVALPHVSNALGTINPIKTMIQKAHAVGIKVLVDAAQSAPHLPIDMQQLDCDFLAFSGHKMCGPTGIGVLYAKERILENMQPIFGGGDMISEVYTTHSKWNSLPWKFEAGTPAIAEAIGLGEAIKYLKKIGMDEIKKHDAELLEFAIKRLQKIPGVKLFGPLDPKIQSGILSFNIDGIHPHDVAEILNGENIAVRAGHHCCMPLMQRLEISATVRASFYLYNDERDVEKLAHGIKKAIEIFNFSH
ncbi:cysteine desulfurase [Candidatus Peregrinibacteria bacterium]|nr:cysteine desulfurase [Candidatus Peregrinibacteria bacterium]